MTASERRALDPESRFYRIAEQGLCIGCGLCQSVAGPDRIRMVRTPEGTERPLVTGVLTEALVDRIYDTCPGTRIEGLPEEALDERATLDAVWGPWMRIVRAYAADEQIRFLGSTGGVLTALGIYLLASGRVEFLLHARAGERQPTWGVQHLSFGRADVIAGAGSRYGPTAPLVDLERVLAREQAFAFIGKPCDVAALRNYARYDARLERLCRYYLVMVCGGFMEPSGMRRFLENIGVREEEVRRFRYRGYGCPGPTRVETADGRVVEKNYLDMWSEDESAWSLPFRCKVCPDAIGEAADIAAADSWPGGSPTREGQKTDPGTNVVLIRTRRGLELLEAAERDGALVTEGDVSARDMDDYQPHQVSKKQAVWARHVGLANAGQLVPEVRRLRIAELARAQGVRRNLEEARGTRRRAKLGRASEPRARAVPDDL